jgi:hypothetical protein
VRGQDGRRAAELGTHLRQLGVIEHHDFYRYESVTVRLTQEPAVGWQLLWTPCGYSRARALVLGVGRALRVDVPEISSETELIFGAAAALSTLGKDALSGNDRHLVRRRA